MSGLRGLRPCTEYQVGKSFGWILLHFNNARIQSSVTM